MEETKGGKGDGKRLTKTWVWDCMAPYWVFDTVVKAELVILPFLSSTLCLNVVSLIPFKCFWAMGSEVATLSTDAKSSSFDAVSRRAVCAGWERLFYFWSISVPFVGVITNPYNSKLTRPMLAGSSVPMPDELMELYNLYQQELHTRRAKDRIVEMKHIRKYCTQD